MPLLCMKRTSYKVRLLLPALLGYTALIVSANLTAEAEEIFKPAAILDRNLLWSLYPASYSDSQDFLETVDFCFVF